MLAKLLVSALLLVEFSPVITSLNAAACVRRCRRACQRQSHSERDIQLALRMTHPSADDITVKALKRANLGRSCTYACTIDGGETFIAHKLKFADELRLNQQAAERHLAPDVMPGSSEKWLFTPIVQAAPLTIEEAHEEKTLAAVATAIKTIGTIESELKQNTLEGIEEQYKTISTSPFFDDASRTLFQQALQKAQELHATLKEQPLVFAHSNLSSRNVFFNPAESQLFFVNWASSGLCYPFYDLASYSIFFCCDGTEHDTALLRAYLDHEADATQLETFNAVKKMFRILDAFELFGTLHNRQVAISLPTGLETFEHYQTIYTNNSPEGADVMLPLAYTQLARALAA